MWGGVGVSRTIGEAEFPWVGGWVVARRLSCSSIKMQIRTKLDSRRRSLIECGGCGGGSCGGGGGHV